VSFQGDGGDFPQLFHLVNNKGDHREVKPSGGRVEVKGQFISILEGDVKLELIQVDCYGVNFSINRHFGPPQNPLIKQEILHGPK